MKAVILNSLSFFVVPTVAGLLASGAARILAWSASMPLDPGTMLGVVAAAAYISCIINAVRIVVWLSHR